MLGFRPLVSCGGVAAAACGAAARAWPLASTRAWQARPAAAVVSCGLAELQDSRTAPTAAAAWKIFIMGSPESGGTFAPRAGGVRQGHRPRIVVARRPLPSSRRLHRPSRSFDVRRCDERRTARCSPGRDEAVSGDEGERAVRPRVHSPPHAGEDCHARPSVSSPASGPTCRSRSCATEPVPSATTASSWPAGATTSIRTARWTRRTTPESAIGTCSRTTG